MSRVHRRQAAQKRRKKMGSSVAYKTIGPFLSQNMGHEDAGGWVTEMQSGGCAAVRQWPTLSFTHRDPPPPPPWDACARAGEGLLLLRVLFTLDGGLFLPLLLDRPALNTWTSGALCVHSGSRRVTVPLGGGGGGRG